MNKQSSGATPRADDQQVGGDHYKKHAITPWQALDVWMSREEAIGFYRGNAIKYLARCQDKGGVEDVKKAQHYISKLIEVMENSSAAKANADQNNVRDHG